MMNTWAATPAGIAILRKRQDEIMRGIHALTRRRELGEVSLEGSVAEEISLVIELGQIQDRLLALGEHLYDGCLVCRPGGGGRASGGSGLPGRTTS